ncbi:MAG: choice-of-anchor Q domain-containing protein [Gemmataceae bacterium]
MMFTGRLIRSMFGRHRKTTRRPVGRFERSQLRLNILENRMVPATITVTGTGDNVAPNGSCTLREAIQSINNGADANADVTATRTGSFGSSDQIIFSSLFNSAQTISFGSQITISNSMTITGKGESLLTLQNTAAAGANARLFTTAAAGTATITLQKMTLTGGNLIIGSNGAAIANEDEDLRLINVTVNNNKTAGSGGAIDMYAFNGHLTLTSCTLTGNSAGGLGGAIHVESYSTVTIDSSTISLNSATSIGGNGDGGALDVMPGADSSITVNNSVLNSNSCGGSSGKLLGGAVFYFESDCTINLTASSFANNSASFGSCVMDIGAGACSVTVDSCTFSANVGSRGCLTGGAINFVSGPNSAGTIFDVRSSTFINNSAASGAAVSMAKAGTLLIDKCQFTTNTIAGVGGVIRGPSEGPSTLSITRSIFTGNTSGGAGGAMYLGTPTGSTNTISNCTFSGNTAGSAGGAIQISGTASYTFNNCTFTGNTATGIGAFANGGALFITGQSKVTINNCTLTANVAAGSLGGQGGGIRRGSSSTIGTTTIISSIIANNIDTAGVPDISFPSAATIGGGANLVGVADVGNFTLATTNGTNYTGQVTAPLDPLLGPLQDNGGATVPHTPTQMPAPTSLAVAHGSQNGLFVDQAGHARPSVGADIGAVQGIYLIPTAIGTMPGTVSAAGGTTYSVTVVYNDETGINTTTINAADLTVSGPGYGTPASPNSPPSITGSGTSVTATYSFDAPPSPGGSWDSGDNGTYTVTLGNNQVADTDSPFSNYVTGGTLGTFQVAIPRVYLVDALGDVDDGNYSVGQQTLREALKRANLSSGTLDTITFWASLDGLPIVLTSELPVTDSVNVVGHGADKTVIDANFASRAFNLNIAGAGSVTMSGVRITNGYAGAGRGGAILSADENVTLDGVWIDSNQTTSGPGGGIGFASSGRLVVLNSTISGNMTTSGSGGGIYIPGGTSTYLLVRNSTISSNVANGSAVGGGIRIGTSTGGSVVRLWNSTITSNFSDGPGGGLSGSTASGAMTVNVESSIVAGNVTSTGTGVDLVGSIITAVNSFIGVGNDGHTLNASGTTIAGTSAFPADPLLGSLANNGGTAPTHLPNPSSPVRDNGSNPTPTLTFDQRGQPRSLQFGVDMGAVESIDEIPKATFNPVANITLSGTSPNTLTITFKDFTEINISTIKASNITILDPSLAPVAILSATPDVMVNGQVRVATYAFAIPGGAWDPSDNGVYTVQMNGSQVFDIDATPNAVQANSSFGAFRVAVGKSLVVDEATDFDDSLIGPGQLSIREALNIANADPYSPDTITFGGLAFVGAVTIPLSAMELPITGNVTIHGTGVSRLTLDGQAQSRIFNINDPSQQATIAISDMTLTNGWVLNSGGAILLNSDKLSLSNCVVSSNTALGAGGGIAVVGSNASGSALLLDTVQMSGNSASGNGGALDCGTGPLLQVSNSTFSGNIAGAFGGGFSAGYLVAGSRLQNTTISNNLALRGGAASIVKGSQSFLNCTIANNEAAFIGGGLYLNNSSLNMILIMNDTIVAGNISGNSADISSNTQTTVNGDYNLIGVSDDGNMVFPGTFNLKGTLASPFDPQLGALQNNGGLTLTRAPLYGSPAINNGEATTSLTYDQRGPNHPRLLGGKVDIGAVEAAPVTVTSVIFGDGTNQRSLVKQIVVNFSEAVNFMGDVTAAFTVHRTGTAGTVGDVSLTAIPATGPASSVTITFSGSLTEYGSLVDGLYNLIIGAAQVSGSTGALDGNNDGIPGGDYLITGTTANKYFRYFGDQNGDATVNQVDYLEFRNAIAGGPGSIFDFDSSGNVDQVDYLEFRNRIAGAP